uniref:DNA glycosylase n=1 Tax=Tanacetum cinerariifolium TaxID=118510 RepID=A0A6L2LT93_TANCI|nr:DNA glycosylase [Tanacetum cinerariifolium]
MKPLLVVLKKRSIAAARREQVKVMKVQRKLKIAHYGRLTSAKYDSCNKPTPLFDPNFIINTTNVDNTVIQEKRCSLITPFSGCFSSSRIGQKRKHREIESLLLQV